MDLLIIVENTRQYDVFHDAWAILEKESNASKEYIGTVNIKTAYIASDNKVPFSRLYPRERLEEGKLKRKGKAVYDATIICGVVGPEDAQYLTYCMHQMLLGQILIVDPNARQGSIPVFFAANCKDPSYDSIGLAKDLKQFIKYVKTQQIIMNHKYVS